MTQQVKVIATKSDNLNSISRACNGKKRTPKNCPLTMAHMLTQTQNKY